MITSTTVEKAVDILFHLHESSDPKGVSAIGRDLGLPKSSAHRLLAALSRRGLVEQNERGEYRPGTIWITLGIGVLERESIVDAARPVLEEGAARLGETFFLVAARSQRIVVLDKVEGSGFLRAAPRIGAEVPVHATAVGKLYLAFAPRQIAPLAHDLKDFTPDTLTDSSALEAAIRDVQSSGWAGSRNEWISGLGVLAAPIRMQGRMIAAVAVAASSPRLEELGGDSLASEIIASAERIAVRLATGREARSPEGAEA